MRRATILIEETRRRISFSGSTSGRDESDLVTERVAPTGTFGRCLLSRGAPLTRQRMRATLVSLSDLNYTGSERCACGAGSYRHFDARAEQVRTARRRRQSTPPAGSEPNNGRAERHRALGIKAQLTAMKVALPLKTCLMVSARRKFVTCTDFPSNQHGAACRPCALERRCIAPSRRFGLHAASMPCPLC